MTTAIEIGIKFGSAASAVGIVASRSLVGFVTLAVLVLVWCIVREVRLALRERRDDATARFMFARCDRPGAAFGQYADVLKSRDNPP